MGWSPNGKQFGGTGVCNYGGLVFLDCETGRAARLGAGEVTAPAWSPDGSMIAFEAHLVLGSEIWMIEAKVVSDLLSTEPPYRPKGKAATLDLKSPFPPVGTLTCVDLQPKANQRMHMPRFDESFNDMRQVPLGDHALGGVTFRIGPGSLQLGSGLVPGGPGRIEGIPVGKQAARIYFVHGTMFSGPANHVADGTTIGYYRVVYEDRSEQPIAIVAGEDVRDWYDHDAAPLSRGIVVWQGKNQMAEWRNITVRLFASGWTNPHPEKKVARIDYLAAGTQAAPFCLAITVEEPVSR